MFCTHRFCIYFVYILRSCFYTSCLCRRVVYSSLALLFQAEFDTPTFDSSTNVSYLIAEPCCLHHVMKFTMIKTYAAIVQTERNGHTLSLYTASSILSSHKQKKKKKSYNHIFYTLVQE